MPELVFILAPGQNHFFAELVGALRHELGLLGVASSVHVGGYPESDPDRAFVLTPPHEYFRLTPEELRPTRSELARTIFIGAEQPGTDFFAMDVDLAPSAGAVFDINAESVRQYREFGVQAEHLPLGWTPHWCRAGDLLDPEGVAPERDIDVLHLGILSPHRGAVLAGAAELLDHRRWHIVLAEDDRAVLETSPAAVFDDRKWELLTRSRVLLNIHVAERPYFEWLRVVQAICNGTYVVSEHSDGIAPLTRGVQLTFGAPDRLGLLAEYLLEDEAARAERARRAYRFLRDAQPLSIGVRRLAEAAVRVTDRRVARSALTEPAKAPPPIVTTEDGQFPHVSQDDDASAVRAALKDLRLDLADVRRHLMRVEAEVGAGGALPAAVLAGETRAWSTAQPRVSVVTALFNYEHHVREALESVLSGSYRDVELVVVDDGSRDRSADVVQALIDEHPGRPIRLVRHPINRGLGAARNTGLEQARGEFTFILDADNAVMPRGLARHVTALDGNPGAAFAYGIVGMHADTGPVGVLSARPWAPRLLRRGNYIDAMVLWRSGELNELGGYTTDHRLWGWEDYELWLRTAETGRYGAFIPQILTRYRATRHSMLSLTNISATTAVSVLCERYPRTMQGVVPPR